MTDRGESSTDQKRHWEQTYSNNPSFFGEEPSEFAAAAVAVFSREGMRTVKDLCPTNHLGEAKKKPLEANQQSLLPSIRQGRIPGRPERRDRMLRGSIESRPVTIHAFGFLVAMAVIVGSKPALMRCDSRKLDPDVCAELIYFALFAGFLVAHVYSVLAYFPGQALEDPLLLLKFWENISSSGGMVGGVPARLEHLRSRAPDPGVETKRRWLADQHSRELRVCRVQEDVVLLRDHSGRHTKNRRLRFSKPFLPYLLYFDRRGRGTPIDGQIARLHAGNRDVVRIFGGNYHEIRRKVFTIDVDQILEGRKG